MVKTIKSSMSQARKKMLEQIKNKEESEVKRKKTAKEKYKELRESIKEPEPTPQSFSDKFEEELKKQLQEMLGDQKKDTTEQFEYTATYKFFNTSPSSSRSGLSYIVILLFGLLTTFTFVKSGVSPERSHNNDTYSGFNPALNILIWVNLSAIAIESKIFSPCLYNAFVSLSIVDMDFFSHKTTIYI